jgi:hypothetical protein
MVNEKYEVEISKLTKSDRLNGLVRYTNDVILELHGVIDFIQFFDISAFHRKNLKNPTSLLQFCCVEKFFEFCITHMALKAPPSSTTCMQFYTSGKRAQKLLISILTTQAI